MVKERKWFCFRCMEYHEIKAGMVLCNAPPMKPPTSEDWEVIVKWLRNFKGFK